MYEIIIRQIAFGADGGPANLQGGIELPIPNETLDKTMMCMRVKYPYIAHSYSFRLGELNSLITGPQPIDKLNSLATMLTSLSEYERVKLEGAVILTDCHSIDDCVKLMYNLDSFELTPNVGEYDSLGRYLAENDFADSLANCPADMMAYFDYDLLGRMGWDDSTNAFVKGHHIRDAENELREPDLSAGSLACYMKMRLCSDQNPDGVWIKFPLSGLGAVDAPEQSGEMLVALASLKANSLDECRAVECISEYPILERCLVTHAGEPVERLLRYAHNLGLGVGELCQYGRDAHAKFAAALEYENRGDLDFAADITQNLRCYDFAPTLEAYAGEHLLEKGVDPTFASCFDLKKLGGTLTANSGALITENGVISRNRHDFVFDHFNPAWENPEKDIRLFCPLEVKTDPGSTLGEQYGDCLNELEYAYATIPNSIAGGYSDAINAALEKEMRPEERVQGLAKYMDNFDLREKVSHIWPSVEVWNGELRGVIDIRIKQDLSPGEFTELTDYCIGQMSDGLGESVEQHPIHTQAGDLYVSFWQSGDGYFMKPEQEFKERALSVASPQPSVELGSEPEQSMEQTMGM